MEKPFIFWPLLSGFAAYMLVLFSWQPRTGVFLDKVCIHQTDNNKKRKSIDSLGGFLRCSQEMLLLWDSTYFSRLWCTFELAAFFMVHGNPDGVRVVPIVRGFFILVCVMVTFLLHLVTVLMWHFQLVGAALVDILGHVFFGIWFVHIARNFASQHFDMDTQIRCFECDKANAWCCTVGHVDPVTKKPVPCDREVIYSVLDQWFDGGKAEFEAHVRRELPGYVHQALGGMLLFSDTLHIGLPALWRQISYWGSDCMGWNNAGIRVLKVLGLWFTLMPIFAGMVVWLSSLVPLRREWSRCCNWLVSLGVAALLGALQYAWILLMDYCSKTAWWAELLLALFQGVLGKVLLVRAGPRQLGEDARKPTEAAHTVDPCAEAQGGPAGGPECEIDSI
jgi:hypothetical protein